MVVRVANSQELHAGGRERGRPARRGAVSRHKGSSGEHLVGLFADRTRYELLDICLLVQNRNSEFCIV
jgi:hypothetical protein